MKVLLVGDIHAMDRPPRNASDSYLDDLIGMLIWIADYADEHEILIVVWAGDIFHHKAPAKSSHSLVLKLIAVVQYYLYLGIELNIVIGNHDISNDVLATAHEKQPIGVLLRAGAKELKGWHKEYPIFGVPWRHDWTTSESSPWEAFEDWRMYPRRDLAGDMIPALAVTHAPIYPPGEAEKQLFELVPTKGDHGLSKAMGNQGSLYYGHIHEDHGIFEVEGVTYANMGALSRGSLTEYNINRKIKVAIWEDGTFTEVEVPHKPASEVLRVAEVAEEKKEKLNLDSFLKQVGSSNLLITDTQSVIGHIQGRKDISAPVKKKAIEILEEVE